MGLNVTFISILLSLLRLTWHCLQLIYISASNLISFSFLVPLPPLPTYFLFVILIVFFLFYFYYNITYDSSCSILSLLYCQHNPRPPTVLAVLSCQCDALIIININICLIYNYCSPRTCYWQAKLKEPLSNWPISVLPLKFKANNKPGSVSTSFVFHFHYFIDKKKVSWG